jgi:hypothetical protein
MSSFCFSNLLPKMFQNSWDLECKSCGSTEISFYFLEKCSKMTCGRKDPFFFSVFRKTLPTVTPSHQEKKHIFFCYAEKDESDLKVAALKLFFIQRRLRIYHPRENEDINTKIATGIENAAVVLVFPTRSLQMSKSGSKILNYADQTKTPILNIKICEDFQPTGWLGAILAAAKSCSTDYNDVMKSLISTGINTNNLVLERDEKNGPQEMEKHLFHGGTKSGDVSAIYHQYGQEFPMEFEVFNELF